MSKTQVFERFIKLASRLFLSVLVLWAVGLTWFSKDLNSLPKDKNSTCDAIIVLTGGSNRINVGIHLLNHKFAKKLFISGVHATVSTRMIQQISNLDSLPNGIELGHAAKDTTENADETKLWMQHNNFISMC